ncbi:MAG: sugar phosphate isomerase/epimerase [Clostridia bacterium]|nr:sugar phosphate isomerase/epimerase [Clostridia bacterium]
MSDFKFGVCLGYNDREKIIQAKEAGIDYFEFNYNAISKADKFQLDELKGFIEELKVPCYAANGMFPGELKVVGPDVDYVQIDEYLDKASEKLSALGADTVVFGSGGARRCPDDWHYKTATEQLVKLCRDHIAPYMRKYGLTCAIEPLRSAECNIITTAARGFEICQLADVSEVKLLVDLYHFDSENEERKSILNYKGNLQHIHIASAKNNRYYPTATDGVDYRSFFNLLRQADYKSMRVSLEGRYDNFANEIKLAVDLLKTF